MSPSPFSTLNPPRNEYQHRQFRRIALLRIQTPLHRREADSAVLASHYGDSDQINGLVEETHGSTSQPFVERCYLSFQSKARTRREHGRFDHNEVRREHGRNGNVLEHVLRENGGVEGGVHDGKGHFGGEERVLHQFNDFGTGLGIRTRKHARVDRSTHETKGRIQPLPVVAQLHDPIHVRKTTLEGSKQTYRRTVVSAMS